VRVRLHAEVVDPAVLDQAVAVNLEGVASTLVDFRRRAVKPMPYTPQLELWRISPSSNRWPWFAFMHWIP
jgi:hypothetical protein